MKKHACAEKYHPYNSSKRKEARVVIANQDSQYMENIIRTNTPNTQRSHWPPDKLDTRRRKAKMASGFYCTHCGYNALPHSGRVICVSRWREREQISTNMPLNSICFVLWPVRVESTLNPRHGYDARNVVALPQMEPNNKLCFAPFDTQCI